MPMGSTSHVDATGAIIPGKAVLSTPAPASVPVSSPVKKAKHSHEAPVVAIVEDMKEEKEAKKEKKEKKEKKSKKDKSS